VGKSGVYAFAASTPNGLSCRNLFSLFGLFLYSRSTMKSLLIILIAQR